MQNAITRQYRSARESMLSHALGLIALLLACSATAQAGERFDIRLSVEGRMREFIVSVPTQGAPEGGYPVVIMLHGSSGEGEIFYNVSGWKELGDIENFVSVFPSSLAWCLQDPDGSNKHTSTKWVCGDLIDEACPDQDFVDDDLFLSVILDSLQARLPINENRLFLSGFSNGCVMSSRIAANHPRMFRALSGGGGNFNKLDSTQPAAPPPYWHCVGTLDDRFTVPFGVAEIPFNDSCLTKFAGVLNRWLGAYHLTQDYEKDSTEHVLSYTFRTPQQGFPPAFYRFSLVRGLDHRYANGSNHPVRYAAMYWQFFQAAAGATSVAQQEPRTGAPLRIQPHPVTDRALIKLRTSADTFRVYDLTGRIVLTGDLRDGRCEIDASQWQPGMYTVVAGTVVTSLIKQ